MTRDAISFEAIAAEEERAARRPANAGRDSLTAEERAAADRAALYATHKAHGTLGVYFGMYPDEAPADYFDLGRGLAPQRPLGVSEFAAELSRRIAEDNRDVERSPRTLRFFCP